MSPPLHEVHAIAANLRAEVREGLGREPRTLPPKLLYDATGARLFREITRLDEYYPTRTEIAILRRCLPELARRIGPRVRVVEPGSGGGEKPQLLLSALDGPVSYVPVDVAADELRKLAKEIGRSHPGLEILPVVADYTRGIPLPRSGRRPDRTVVFFPGSTIGNFEPAAARDFLERFASEAGAGGALILGADLAKPRSIVEPAYNDAKGVTAAFNLNVLRHLNRELGTDFELEAFGHEAAWVPERSRMEMRLVSLRDQVVTIPDRRPDPNGRQRPDAESSVDRVRLERGEWIVTEHSYKHTPASLDRLTWEAGWQTLREWTDEHGWFSVRLLERRENGKTPEAGTQGRP